MKSSAESSLKIHLQRSLFPQIYIPGDLTVIQIIAGWLLKTAQYQLGRNNPIYIYSIHSIIYSSNNWCNPYTRHIVGSGDRHKWNRRLHSKCSGQNYKSDNCRKAGFVSKPIQGAQRRKQPALCNFMRNFTLEITFEIHLKDEQKSIRRWKLLLLNWLTEEKILSLVTVYRQKEKGDEVMLCVRVFDLFIFSVF